MKKPMFCIAVLSIFAFAAANDAHGQCANSYTEPGTGFTFCPPGGWTSRRDAADTYSKFFGTIGTDGSQPNINIRQQASTLSLDAYSLGSMKYIFKELKNMGFTKMTATDVSDFKTTSGISGIRMTWESEYKGSPVRSFQYLFDRGGATKIIVTGTLSETNPGLIDTIESAAKSVRIAN